MEREKLLEMSGSVESVVFRNEKNGYAVIELNNGEELVTAVGVMPFVGVGEQLKIIGEWVNSQTYGIQFKVKALERTRPSDSAAILKYLSSGAVRGVGAATAKKIVEAYGDKALDILEKDPKRLCTIRGISPGKAEAISGEFRRMGGVRDIMARLSGYGITPEEAVNVWKAYGGQAFDHIRDDPYCLCREEIGIGFGRADRLAASLDHPPDDGCRLRAGIVYVLRHNEGNGHTCLPEDKLIPASARMLGVEKGPILAALQSLTEDGSLIRRAIGGRDFLFTPALYRSEVYIAGRIRMMLRFPAKPVQGVEGFLAEVEQKEGIQYADLQKAAVREALSKGMLILTGGPGTGKTTTLNAIIRVLQSRGEKVFCAAPTGRAAKRMAELTGQEAKTIHRMLQVKWDENDRPVFEKNERNLLECDALIIDELSMVDVGLFEAVLRALPLGCRLIMVGDCDQLPSVGPGNVLGDLISSGLLPVVKLQKIFRQSMKSLIVTNAHLIVQGKMPELGNHQRDFFFLPYRTSDEVSNVIVGLCSRRLPKSYGYSPLWDIQVLTPGRKGGLGTGELNRRLREALNPPDKGKKEITLNGTLFREGDKVMQTRNDYSLPWARGDGTCGEGAYNGDLGVLLSIDRSASLMTVRMDDRTVTYQFESASTELEPAFAMTVHKSQGNEFPAVVMPVFRSAVQLMYRNLLYTAVTRAKSLLILVGREEVIRIMVQNDRKTRRYTGLASFLKDSGGEEENR